MAIVNHHLERVAARQASMPAALINEMFAAVTSPSLLVLFVLPSVALIVNWSPQVEAQAHEAQLCCEKCF